MLCVGWQVLVGHDGGDCDKGLDGGDGGQDGAGPSGNHGPLSLSLSSFIAC
jgi:hypothetical protein